MTHGAIPDGKNDVLIHEVTNDHTSANSHFVIHILPGNPGLISFYESFAASLSSLLKQRSLCQSVSITICGKSLRGFETGPGLEDARSRGMLGLTETVLGSESDLEAILDTLQVAGRISPPAKVILLGHSVGAYILLELLRRQSERRKGNSPVKLDIVGGLLVFPTVTWIAKSSMGRIITVRILHLLASQNFLTLLQPILSIPFLPAVVGMLAFGILSILPTVLLYHIVRLVTWFPPQASSTLVRFLKSKNGVRQALYVRHQLPAPIFLANSF